MNLTSNEKKKPGAPTKGRGKRKKKVAYYTLNRRYYNKNIYAKNKTKKMEYEKKIRMKTDIISIIQKELEKEKQDNIMLQIENNELKNIIQDTEYVNYELSSEENNFSSYTSESDNELSNCNSNIWWNIIECRINSNIPIIKINEHLKNQFLTLNINKYVPSTSIIRNFMDTNYIILI